MSVAIHQCDLSAFLTRCDGGENMSAACGSGVDDCQEHIAIKPNRTIPDARAAGQARREVVYSAYEHANVYHPP